MLPLYGVEIGNDDFSAYADGPIDGFEGGNGWSYNGELMDQTNPGGESFWESPGFGDANDQTVSSGTLITGQSISTGGGGGSLRRFGQDRVNAAIRGTGQVFYKVEMTRSAASVWSGLSHMDFGTEKVQFGVPFANAGTDTIGIEVSNTAENGVTSGTINLVDGTTYTLVCVLDFSNNKVAMFVDPPATAYWTGAGNNNADVVRTFNNDNWASDVRLASDGDTTWDNLVVGTSATDVGLQDFVDADGDGLPGDWEMANDLNDDDDGEVGETSPGAKDGPNGALGDPDMDGLTNLEEYDGTGILGFDGGTDPQEADTDGDTLLDGPEVLTNNTDPLDPDSDNDELSDGAEINTHSTNPNVADTDGGGTNDGTEIALGTLPQAGNASDDPATNGDLDLIGIEMFDYPDGPIDGKTGGDGFDFDNQDTPDSFTGHTGTSSDWDKFDGLNGDPQIVCQRLRTDGSGALRQFNGLGEGNTPGSSEASGGIYPTPTGTQVHSVFWVKFDMTRSSAAAWSGLSLYSFGDEKAFIGVTGGGAATDALSYEEPGGANQQITNLILNDGETNTIVVRVEPAEGFVDVYLNPDLNGGDPFVADPNGSDILAVITPTSITAIRCASAGQAEWDNISVSGTWDGLSTTPANTGGLRDSFAAGFGLTDGPSGNGDGDNLTNLEEQDNSTSPILADTDGDNVNDDIELTGSSNTFPNPVTDPCNADSDGDGIDDGDEISGVLNIAFSGEATDPNVADTDIDTYSDLAEVQLGTDPNNAASNPGAEGIIVIDGVRDSAYGAPTSIQTINSAFGSNEIDAAYTKVEDGKLFLMITGNLQNNFNKLEVFFDTGDQITTNVYTSAGNDNSGNMNGMRFDTDFSPEYQIIMRRGFDGSTNLFDLDISNLATAQSDFYGNLFSNSQTGAGSTGTGTVNSNPIEVAYDDSNTAGITDGDNSGSAADQAAAAAVTTGIELCIDLTDLGNPSGSMKIMVLLNNDSHNFMSNQTLGGLPVGTDNLGNPANVDFSTYAGDQYFPVAVASTPTLKIEVVSYNGTTMVVDVTGAEPGKTYDITSSITLSGFAPTGVTFTSETATGISIPANALTVPRQFFSAAEQSP